MTFRGPIGASLLAGGVSAALLLGALAFQHWGGMQPCVLCLWQRWPHVVAIAAGFVGMFLIRQGRRAPAGWATLAAALALAVTAGIGAYHAGVELHWWEGTAACGATGPTGTTAAALRDRLLAAPVVRCDEIAWSLFGISMAGWNFLVSGALALIGVKGSLALIR